MDLTKRQKEITDLLLQGLSQQEIANRLFVAISTVKSHISEIMRKNNVHTVGAICGLFVKEMQDEITDLKKKVKYYKNYKKMWEVLKLREFQERRG